MNYFENSFKNELGLEKTAEIVEDELSIDFNLNYRRPRKDEVEPVRKDESPPIANTVTQKPFHVDVHVSKGSALESGQKRESHNISLYFDTTGLNTFLQKLGYAAPGVEQLIAEMTNSQAYWGRYITLLSIRVPTSPKLKWDISKLMNFLGNL